MARKVIKSTREIEPQRVIEDPAYLAKTILDQIRAVVDTTQEQGGVAISPRRLLLVVEQEVELS